ncbi:MAG TPA: LuxR C-terminal-related transcriptional regulator [Amycolatopsis sp.]|uniref:ATP-binding protein n=1 Tax=Amycolatopsis sp. TaxID=37632 RepID=UPI002B493112|nr:LuxR C-terminal-related transcriptional regulator [Amycolatopsis sp.]HKS45954.1 LuxR C-terminal-related transcriptional regulator [Amycolatopsis sp.]
MVERTSSGNAGNMPVAVTSFVGRRREIGEVRQRLAAGRLVTLTGVGGVGKTRLAIEAATESHRAFTDGAWLVDLAPVREPELVGRAVATALGIPDQSTKPAVAQLIDHLARRQALVLLDNCEHLIDACAALTDRLLRACARVRVLATSRQALGIAGEHIYLVPPLSAPDPDSPPPAAALGQYESVNLLVDRAVAIRPGFAVTKRNAVAVARLCARLDGIPLAIELAASRLRSLVVDEVIDRLEDRFGLLTGGSRAALPRQRTLRALIDWSYELCSPGEKLLWARLSAFAGGFDLAAAEGVCAGDGLAREEILDLVDQLVAQSVLLAGERDGRTRYRMLETIREYGWERLAASGEHTEVRTRHQEFFGRLAERIAAEWEGPGQEAGLAALRADHGNLRSALEWCVTTGSTKKALSLVTALRYHWCADGFLSEGRRWIDRALALPGHDEPERVTALWVAAWVMLLQGDYAEAETRLTECEKLAGELGHAVAPGMVLCLRGTWSLFRGDLAEALACFESASAKLTPAGYAGGILPAMFQLTITQVHAGDERAAETGERAIALSEELGERWARSYALWALGFHAWTHGELASATALTRAGLLIQRGFNDHVGTALMIELLAWIAAAKKEFGHAARLLGAIRSIWRTIGTTLSAFGPHLGNHHARCEREVLRALRAEAWEAALAEGGRMDHDQAISYALDGPERAETAAPPDPEGVLTRREHEVAVLVAQGLSNRKIAESLVVSPRTVDGHVEHILAKLGFTSRAQVAAWVAARKQADG